MYTTLSLNISHLSRCKPPKNRPAWCTTKVDNMRRYCHINTALGTTSDQIDTDKLKQLQSIFLNFILCRHLWKFHSKRGPHCLLRVASELLWEFSLSWECLNQLLCKCLKGVWARARLGARSIGREDVWEPGRFNKKRKTKVNSDISCIITYGTKGICMIAVG